MMHYYAVNEHAQILTLWVVYDTIFGLRKYNVLVIPFSLAPKFVQLYRHMGRICQKSSLLLFRAEHRACKYMYTLSTTFLFYPLSVLRWPIWGGQKVTMSCVSFAGNS